MQNLEELTAPYQSKVLFIHIPEQTMGRYMHSLNERTQLSSIEMRVILQITYFIRWHCALSPCWS